jgi:predicted ATPase
LPNRQAVEVIRQVAHGKALPPEVVAQIVAKTDGVPLFVEELTKMVLESGLLQEQEDRYALTGPLPPLAIPAILHDSLMARLDRLTTVKGLAQLAATLGREFASTLLHAVAPWDEETVHQGLHQLVAAEFLYQQGVPPQATYTFKHALIQEAAYQSLLKSTRQQYHRQIAQVLETQFPETAETQPELLAHHYTAAGLSAQAIGYWQRAGQRAVERSAHAEALRHLTTGLALLTTLPETLARAQQELDIQLALGPVLMAAKGNAAPEVAQAYSRARTLCHQVGETPRLFPALFGLWRVYFVRAEVQAARDVGEQLLALAQHQRDSALRLEAHRALGTTLYFPGELPAARGHLEQGLALYHPHEHRAHAVRYGRDPGMDCHIYRAWVLWTLGYPDQAREAMRQALALVEGLAHPVSLATTWFAAAYLAQWCRHVPDVRAQADAVITLATEQGFPQWLAAGTFFQGWALATQGQAEAGIAQLRQGLAAWRATGAEIGRPRWLTMLAEAYGHVGQPEAGLAVLAEALALVEQTGQRIYEAELYRLQGDLMVLHAGAEGSAEAEPCFQRALDVARHQEAKALELRAARSLSRLWQQQGKHTEARELLAPIYHWFTEGFDMVDLQEAKALLDALEG